MLAHMRVIVIALGLVAAVAVAPAFAADTTEPGPAAQQVESGARKTGEGLAETARGVGNTIVDGTRVAGNTIADAAKTTGRNIGEAGRTVGRSARNAWETIRDGALDMADGVVDFLKRPF